MTSRYYCFTLYNEWDTINHDESKIRFIQAGKETCPKTGNKHWQGFVQFKEPVRLKQAQKLIHPGINFHIEKCKGNYLQNITYTCKDGDIYRWGKAAKQGTRTDLVDFTDALLMGTPLNQVIRAHPTTYVRYHSGLDHLAAIIENEQIPPLDVTLYESQAALIARLVSLESRRKVQFVIDKKGGYGKSTVVAPYMAIHHNALVLQAGIKTADAMYAYNKEKIVIIDVPKSHRLTIEDYEIIELFTNFTFLSTKYVPKRKYPVCKVIVFTNYCPDLTYLSEDRYILYNVSQCHEVAEGNTTATSNLETSYNYEN